MKFPRIIHATVEESGNDDPWLHVHTDGVSSMDVPGQRVAIYRLVDIGRVQIAKSFVRAQRKGKR